MNLDEPPARDFLAGAMVARIATLSRKGEPHITPLWFVRDRGRIYMTTREASPVVRNVLRTPAVVLLFDSEQPHLAGSILRLRGRAVFRKGRGIMWRTLLRQLPKYRLSPGAVRNLLAHHRRFFAMARYYAERGGESGVIEVLPESAELLPRNPA